MSGTTWQVKQVHYQWIKFVQVDSPRRTQIWSCRNLRSDDELGVVQWYGPWRQYCFLAKTGVVFSAGCLKDVQTFIENLMEARKK